VLSVSYNSFPQVFYGPLPPQLDIPPQINRANNTIRYDPSLIFRIGFNLHQLLDSISSAISLPLLNVLILLKSMDGTEVTTPSRESKWEEMVSQIEPVANPLASRKLTKRLYKVLKKGEYCEGQ